MNWSRIKQALTFKIRGRVPVWAVLVVALIAVSAFGDSDEDSEQIADDDVSTTSVEMPDNDDAAPERSDAPTSTQPDSSTSTSQAAATTSTSSTTSTPTTSEPSTVETSTTVPSEEGSDLAALNALTVTPEPPRVGYQRESWSHWDDVNGSGCDARRDAVMAFATAGSTIDAATCSASGSWYSVFDGVSTTNSSSFDLDHIVALAEAHDSGGANWTAAKKQQFANYPANLVLVSASSNRSKSDKDVAEWRPAEQAWCTMARYVISVKSQFGLSVDAAERDALAEMLETCGQANQISWVNSADASFTAPEIETTTTVAVTTTTVAVTTTTAASTPPTTVAPTTTVADNVPANPGDTKNCPDFSTYQEAKTWFDTYFPYYGDVARLDSDGDGEPCESLPGGPSA